jgi:hypothetical protein
MANGQLKFIFLKTPQIKHRFSTGKNQLIYPVIRHEIYHAKLVGDSYEFFGRSYSGVVSVDDFHAAIREGYISLVLEP